MRRFLIWLWEPETLFGGLVLLAAAGIMCVAVMKYAPFSPAICPSSDEIFLSKLAAGAEEAEKTRGTIFAAIGALLAAWTVCILMPPFIVTFLDWFRK